ncbi:hypothetical protein CBR_g41193 [Chara braunii]|nr:hypothetical protein CBR_g41193 [Chara braunii]|eukprot:GBG64272.1 hypothetical protein CBR_g41193 [Chara braunii]
MAGDGAINKEGPGAKQTPPGAKQTPPGSKKQTPPGAKQTRSGADNKGEQASKKPEKVSQPLKSGLSTTQKLRKTSPPAALEVARPDAASESSGTQNSQLPFTVQGAVLQAWVLPTPVVASTISADGAFLAVGLEDGNVMVLNTHLGRLTFMAHRMHAPPSAMAFGHAPNQDHRLVCTTKAGEFHVFDVKTGIQRSTPKPTPPKQSIDVHDIMTLHNTSVAVLFKDNSYMEVVDTERLASIGTIEPGPITGFAAVPGSKVPQLFHSPHSLSILALGKSLLTNPQNYVQLGTTSDKVAEEFSEAAAARAKPEVPALALGLKIREKDKVSAIPVIQESRSDKGTGKSARSDNSTQEQILQKGTGAHQDKGDLSSATHVLFFDLSRFKSKASHQTKTSLTTRIEDQFETPLDEPRKTGLSARNSRSVRVKVSRSKPRPGSRQGLTNTKGILTTSSVAEDKSKARDVSDLGWVKQQVPADKYTGQPKQRTATEMSGPSPPPHSTLVSSKRLHEHVDGTAKAGKQAVPSQSHDGSGVLQLQLPSSRKQVAQLALGRNVTVNIPKITPLKIPPKLLAPQPMTIDPNRQSSKIAHHVRITATIDQNHDDKSPKSQDNPESPRSARSTERARSCASPASSSCSTQRTPHKRTESSRTIQKDGSSEDPQEYKHPLHQIMQKVSGRGGGRRAREQRVVARRQQILDHLTSMANRLLAETTTKQKSRLSILATPKKSMLEMLASAMLQRDLNN